MSSLPSQLQAAIGAPTRSWWRQNSQPSGAVGIAFALIFLVLDWVSFVYPMRGTSITAWNPQSALAVVFLLHFPKAWWIVATVTPLAAWLWGAPQSMASLALASAALVAGYALTGRLLHQFVGLQPTLSTRRELLWFAAAVCGGAGVLALLYVFAIGFGGVPSDTPLGTAFVRRWVGESVSYLVTLPLLFWMLDAERRRETQRMLASTESWVVLACACSGAYIVFTAPPEEQLRLFYLLMLPLAWAAARFGQTGSVWMGATIQVMLMLALQTAPYRPLIVFDLHTVLSVMGVTALLLGATVDERRQADERHRQAEQNAAAAELAAALAHELQQPLAAMRNYARVLDLMNTRGEVAQRASDGPDPVSPSQAPFDPAIASVTQKLVAEITRASLVVQRLRDFFRRGAMELAPTQIETLARDVLQAQAGLAEQQGVTLDLLAPDRLPPVLLDAPQFGVVLRNLVVNAIEAAAQADPARRHVQVLVTAGHDLVDLYVKDSGPGLTPSQVHAIFESPHSDKPQGMGLGLAISRAIVHNHGGTLWAEAGAGGCFRVSLPVSAAEAVEA